MTTYGKTLTMALIAVLPLITSCSDDDAPKMPSLEIVKVDIYKTESVDMFQKLAQYKFTYDDNGRIKDVRTDYKAQEVIYSYGTNKWEYRWVGNDQSVGGAFVARFEASLRSDRIQVGSVNYEAGSSTAEIYNYSYHYSGDGYLSDATFAGNQSFSYEWGSTSMVIQSNPSKYNAEYLYSNVDNNYSIDLNVLPLLVDARANVLLELNAYAQLADKLGKRYPSFLQDKDYAYSYFFDSYNRLVQIVQEPVSMVPTKQDTFWFLISYSE